MIFYLNFIQQFFESSIENIFELIRHVAVTIEDGHPVIGSVVKGFSPFNVGEKN